LRYVPPVSLVGSQDLMADGARGHGGDLEVGRVVIVPVVLFLWTTLVVICRMAECPRKLLLVILMVLSKHVVVTLFNDIDRLVYIVLKCNLPFGTQVRRI